MGQQGFLRLLPVELVENRFDLPAEKKRLRKLPDCLLLIHRHILLVHVIHIARAGLRQIVDQTEAENLQLIRQGLHLAQDVPNVKRPQDMLGYRFAPGTKKLESAPGRFFQHPDFEQKIRYLLHLFNRQ
ncbi:MAG: hypothetical protein A2Z43_07135 [Syntrophobacterales bacterium RBG_19FT_COMBO_59_10]|nr:MAG: hypothetical protein A2Z43_07135 [Syntrophobacterales bacterium RBG_19FT_COMBO_59_10]